MSGLARKKVKFEEKKSYKKYTITLFGFYFFWVVQFDALKV